MTGGSFSQRSKARLSPGQNSPRNFPSQPLKKSTKRNRNQKDSKTLPIPRGNSPYAMAKRAEYEERNLRKAEYYYKQSIKIGERVESALKDLASVLH